MKRLLVRISVVASTLMLGSIAIAQSPRAQRTTGGYAPGSIKLSIKPSSGVVQAVGTSDAPPAAAQPAGDDFPTAQQLFGKPPATDYRNGPALAASPGTNQAASPDQPPARYAPGLSGAPAALPADVAAEAGPLPLNPARGAQDDVPPAAAFGQGPSAAARDAAPMAGNGKPGPQQLEGPQTPSLTVEKLVPDEVQVGKPATFEIRVRNVGSATARDVMIHDDIPQGAQFVSSEPRASRGVRGELVWGVGDLKPGEETSVRVELLPTAEGELGSVASVHFAAEVSARTVATRPELTVEAIAPTDVLLGEDFTLKIRVSNPGSGVATGVILVEHAPTNVEHEAGPELEYNIGNLKPKESRDLELTLKAAKAGRFANVLSVRGEGQLHAEARTPLNVVAAELAVALEGPRRRYLDRQAVYTLSVSNPGTATAKDVNLIATLPPGMKFVEANNAGHYDPQTRTIQWLLEELPAGEKGSVTLAAMPVQAGEQPIRIAGSAQRGLNVEKQEAVLVEGVAAILFEVADLADPVEVGGETTYEIRVVNQGSKAAANVQLVAILPPQMKAVAAEGPTRYEVQGQQVRFQELPRLAPKADTTYRLRVQCLGPGDMRVRVQLTTDEIRAPITKEESTRVYSDQ